MSRGVVFLCLIAMFVSPLVVQCGWACALAATIAEERVFCVFEPIDGGDTAEIVAVLDDDPSGIIAIGEEAPAQVESLPSRPPIDRGSLESRRGTTAPRPSPIRARLAWLQTFVI